MKQWMSYTSPLIITFILLSFAFMPKAVEVPEPLKVKNPVEVEYPKDESAFNVIVAIPPFLGSSFVGFKEALAFKESSGDYFSVNTLGYLGKYQFGIGTLQLMGVYDATSFLKDSKLQEEVFKTNIARNKWILRRDIERFSGKTINGIKVTESGMLAAAHLAGAGNVKKYLRTGGKYDVNDAYGTSIAKYMKQFAGYDVSFIAAKRNPKVSKI